MSSESFPGELTTVFAHLHGMLLSEHDATAAVGQLAGVARQLIPTAAGAGVSLLGEDGTRVSTASTDPAVEAADAAQYELGMGPYLSAWATGAAQRIEDTITDSRWAGAAAETGIRSVLSVPLVHGGHSLRALKVYARSPAAFGEPEERLLGQLADAAATLLGAVQPAETLVRLSATLKAVLASRETVGLAAGVLMAREQLDVDAYLHHSLSLPRLQRDILAQAANEILIDLAPPQAPYASDLRQSHQEHQEQSFLAGGPALTEQNAPTQDADVMDHETPED